MDPQVVEVLGRQRLVAELLRAGLEVATPVRDRGVDVIAYADLDPRLDAFVARPVQLKAAAARGFSLDAKYARFPGLLLAYVWGVVDEAEAATYALTYPEALAVAADMGWTRTPSWAGGRYANTSPGMRLRDLLAPHRMTPDRWWAKVVAPALPVPPSGAP